MTVTELIKALSKYDPETPVVLANREFGFDTLKLLTEIETVLAEEGDSDFVSSSHSNNGHRVVKAVCLGPEEPSRVPLRQRL
jgi:hypothetical protein